MQNTNGFCGMSVALVVKTTYDGWDYINPTYTVDTSLLKDGITYMVTFGPNCGNMQDALLASDKIKVLFKQDKIWNHFGTHRHDPTPRLTFVVFEKNVKD